MPTIPLTNSKNRAIVDARHLQKVLEHNWLLNPDGYAQTTLTLDGKSRSMTLHRLVMFLETGILSTYGDNEVDHYPDRDKLYCVVSNLRFKTHAKNILNRETWGKSKYRGVAWCKKSEKWKGKFQNCKMQMHLGYFKTEKEAARAWNKACVKYRAPEDRYLNNISDSDDEDKENSEEEKDDFKNPDGLIEK